MTTPKITLYFDIVSPFGYIAYHVLRHSRVFSSVQTTYVPIFLGGVMKACGNRPPIEIKNKDKWIGTERIRWAKLLEVPITETMPPGFPVLTLAIQRALTAITISHPDKLINAADAFYREFWVDCNQNKVDKPEGIKEVLEQVLGGASEAENVVKRSTEDEVKQLLNRKGQEAMDEGAFGVPWMVATNADGKKESFWGVDHLGLVALHLGLSKPELNETGWRAML